MKIRTRMLLGILLVVGVGFYFLISWIVEDLRPQYHQATEEPLVDSARILATLAAVSCLDGKLNVQLFRTLFRQVQSESFEAQIFDFLKTEVDFRVYITDSKGIVVFDSDAGRDEGKDYSEWHDVQRTLLGQYGARTSNDLPNDPTSSVMYVAAPINVGGEIIGVLSIGKPTGTANQFVELSKRRIMVGAIVSCLAIVLVSVFVARMVSHPIQRLTDYARAIRDGGRVALPALGHSEIRELGVAFEQMREALDGKQYVENYVQSLTHEVKSPLSAISGATELLREDMPVERRDRFLDNIQSETRRIQKVVDKLLLLSALENRQAIEEVEEVELFAMIEEIRNDLFSIMQLKKLNLVIQGERPLNVQGERFLLYHAVFNLIQNAVEFSPEGEEIVVEVNLEGSSAVIRVVDSGPGIPEYALARVFDRFYSLKRPETGKKSSGLGLSLVQEVAELHRGRVEITNGKERGAVSVLRLPVGGPYHNALHDFSGLRRSAGGT